MRYLSFSIYHFKPLLHQHTEQLDISELPKIIIVQGENGSVVQGKGLRVHGVSSFHNRSDFSSAYQRL